MLYNTLFIIFMSKYINKYDGSQIFLTLYLSQIVTSSLTSLSPVFLLDSLFIF